MPDARLHVNNRTHQCKLCLAKTASNEYSQDIIYFVARQVKLLWERLYLTIDGCSRGASERLSGSQPKQSCVQDEPLVSGNDTNGNVVRHNRGIQRRQWHGSQVHLCSHMQDAYARVSLTRCRFAQSGCFLSFVYHVGSQQTSAISALRHTFKQMPPTCQPANK